MTCLHTYTRQRGLGASKCWWHSLIAPKPRLAAICVGFAQFPTHVRSDRHLVQANPPRQPNMLVRVHGRALFEDLPKMDFAPCCVPLKQATKGVPSKNDRQLEPWKSKNGRRQFWAATLPKSETELLGMWRNEDSDPQNTWLAPSGFTECNEVVCFSRCLHPLNQCQRGASKETLQIRRPEKQIGFGSRSFQEPPALLHAAGAHGTVPGQYRAVPFPAGRWAVPRSAPSGLLRYVFLDHHKMWFHFFVLKLSQRSGGGLRWRWVLNAQPQPK